MKQIAYISIIIILYGCGTKKATRAITEEDITTARLVEEYYESTLEYTTFEAKTRAKYSNNGNANPVVTVQIRIEKDKTIWIDASLLGFSGARALITPTTIKFYDKINNQYFDNDYSFLSEYAGVDLNFDQLQRLLTGQTIYDLREGKYTFTKEHDYYRVTPKRSNPLFDLLFEIGTQPLMVKNQQVLIKEDRNTMNISYEGYNQVNGKPFPTKIQVNANDGKRTAQVDIEYKSVNLNNTLKFPFKIPSGYKEILIDGK